MDNWSQLSYFVEVNRHGGEIRGGIEKRSLFGLLGKIANFYNRRQERVNVLLTRRTYPRLNTPCIDTRLSRAVYSIVLSCNGVWRCPSRHPKEKIPHFSIFINHIFIAWN